MLEIDMLSIGTFKTAFAGPPVNEPQPAEQAAPATTSAPTAA